MALPRRAWAPTAAPVDCGRGGADFCDLATLSCVECRTNADCGGGGSVCQPDHTCN